MIISQSGTNNSHIRRNASQSSNVIDERGGQTDARGRHKLGSKSPQRDPVAAYLETCHLTKCADTRVGFLSGGEKRRLAIAFEMIKRPALLVLDEPLSGLDDQEAHYMMTMLGDVARQTGAAVVLSLHQPDVLLLAAMDRMLVLEEDNRENGAVLGAVAASWLDDQLSEQRAWRRRGKKPTSRATHEWQFRMGGRKASPLRELLMSGSLGWGAVGPGDRRIAHN